MDIEQIVGHIAGIVGLPARPDGRGGYLVRCPAHLDSEPSLHVSSHERNGVLIKCFGGCNALDVLAAAELTWRDLYSELPASRTRWQITDEYRYQDHDGRHLFTVVRGGHGRNKRFAAFHFDEAGALRWTTTGVPRVLYRLPEVITAVGRGQAIYLCEGEKDVDAMRTAYGVAATTNPFGGVAWARQCEEFGYAQVLRQARLVVVQDRDSAGRRRTAAILASLDRVASSLVVVEAAIGNDAFDHIRAGLALDDFVPVRQRVLDEQAFAALPQAFFETAAACNLSHLDYRTLVEVARHSVRREDKQVQWREVTGASSWLAGLCNGASPSKVRESLARLVAANVLLCDETDMRSGQARRFRINGDYVAWRAAHRGAR